MTEHIRLIAFPGAPNLPVFLGIDDGHFRRHGVDVELTTTPSSIYQFEALAGGEFDIAGTAFDNVVAYREGQGAAKLAGPLEVVAFMGASQVELSLVAGAAHATVAALAGTDIAMDALDTGFAFVLHEMLAHAGLTADAVTLHAVGATPQRFAAVRDGTHAATLTIEPFTSLARAAGLAVLDTSTARLPSYQGGVFAATAAWASGHDVALGGFVAGYLDALAVARDAGQRRHAEQTLARHMPAIAPAVLGKVVDNLLEPRTGLTPDAAVSRAGVDTVLRLRRRHHPHGDALGAPDRYLRLHRRIALVQ